MDEPLPSEPERDPVHAPPFWLSHHRFADRHACFACGPLFVCARCLGTYPVLLVVLAYQLKRPFAPPRLDVDPLLLVGLALPAVLDWSLGQLTRWRGHNAIRFASGVLLGGSLGRAIYMNMRQPGSPLVYGFLLGLCAVAGIVWGLRQVLRFPGR